jgi:hypothetical protein
MMLTLALEIFKHVLKLFGAVLFMLPLIALLAVIVLALLTPHSAGLP